MANSLLAKDWAYEPSDKAKDIYLNKQTQIPCAKIDELLNNKDTQSIYVAIRDAGLFKDKECKKYIDREERKLLKEDPVREAIAFYNYRLGDLSQLQALAKSFDENAKKIGDHQTVELFGYLDDWDVSGRRLAIHSGYSDGAGSELLCSAIMWRRILQGNETTEKKWKLLIKMEKVNEQRSLHLLNSCK